MLCPNCGQKGRALSVSKLTPDSPPSSVHLYCKNCHSEWDAAFSKVFASMSQFRRWELIRKEKGKLD